jgi:hypothetical protein
MMMENMKDVFRELVKDKPQFREKPRSDEALVIVGTRAPAVTGDADQAANGRQPPIHLMTK